MSEFHIVEYDEVAKQIDEVKEYSNFIPNTTTKEGYEKSKRVSLDIGKLLTALEKTRKDKKAFFIEGGKQVDSQAKSIAKQLEEMQAPHKLAYKELDNIKKKMEADRKQKLEDRIEMMRLLPENMSESSSEEIKLAMNDLANESCEDFQEYTAQALKTRNASQEAMSLLLTKVIKADKDAIELAELREKQRIQEQKERDERIAKEAKEKAEAEALAKQKAIEAEKQKAIEAEERAKQQAIEAEKRAKEQEEAAKKAAAEAEERRLADIEAAKQAEIKRQKDAEETERLEAEKREANKKYLAKTHNDILSVLIENGISEKDGKTMITLAAKNQLPKLTINY